MIAVGVEVRPGQLRAVSVTGSGTVACAADAAAGDEGPVETAVVRLAERLQTPPDAPTCVAWGAPNVVLERVDITGVGPAGLGRLLGEWRGIGVSAVMIESEPDGSQRALCIRWDQRAVDRVVDALVDAGFAVAGVVPASRARAWAPDRRDSAHGAAVAAAGLVPARPARSLTAGARAAPPAAPWVIERVTEPRPEPPARPRRRRSWRRNGR